MPKVLVVDDEEAMVRSLSTLLRHEGYDVVAAVTGSEALEATRTQRPALILLDVLLPGLDGIEVCRRIRTWSSVPIIMLTARTAEAHRGAGLEVGANDYVTKPFSGPELVARVAAHLRRVRMDEAPTVIGTHRGQRHRAGTFRLTPTACYR